jgi:hypothetical protein
VPSGVPVVGRRSFGDRRRLDRRHLEPEVTVDDVEDRSQQVEEAERQVRGGLDAEHAGHVRTAGVAWHERRRDGSRVLHRASEHLRRETPARELAAHRLRVNYGPHLVRVTRQDMQAWMPQVRPAEPLALEPDPALAELLEAIPQGGQEAYRRLLAVLRELKTLEPGGELFKRARAELARVQGVVLGNVGVYVDSSVDPETLTHSQAALAKEATSRPPHRPWRPAARVPCSWRFLLSRMDFTRPERCRQQRTGREDRHSKLYEIPDNLRCRGVPEAAALRLRLVGRARRRRLPFEFRPPGFRGLYITDDPYLIFLKVRGKRFRPLTIALGIDG